MAMILNGTNNAELTYPVAVSSQQDMTFFCLIETSTPPNDTADDQTLLAGCNEGDASYRMMAARIDSSNAKIYGRVRMKSGVSEDLKPYDITPSLGSTKYRVAVRWNQISGTAILNVDDSSSVLDDGPNNPGLTELNKLVVGASLGSVYDPANFFKGKIQYAAQWIGTALSDTELADLMDGTTKPKDSATTPDYSYPLISNGNSDIGGTALTLVNSPTFDGVDLWNAGATTTETLDNVTLEPAAGKQYVTIGATPDLTYKSLLYGTNPAADNPDQLESDTVTSDGKAITLRDNGKFKVDNVGTNVQTFNYRIYDADGDGWSAMATATVTPQAGEPDTTKPNIEIIGSSTVFVDIGGTFTDQGALVTDNVDGNTTIYSNVTVTTASANTFTLPYDYTDGADNVGDTAYRTVVVRDPDEVTGSKAILRSIWSPII